MKWFKHIACSCFLVLLSLGVSAQDSSKIEVEHQLEKTFEELDTEESGVTGEQLAQFLEDLAANPINLNTANSDELLQIPGFNIVLVRAVLAYRKSKPFESKQELLKVKGLGEASYLRMKPYVTIGQLSDRLKGMYNRPEYWLSGNRIEILSRVQQILEDQEGFVRPDSLGGYLGSATKYYQRFKMKSDHLSLNLTQEKDAGETLSNPTGFDYSSWHVALTQNGKLKSLVVGDYSLSFGQGLVIWTGGSFGKGREVTGIINKNERGLRPYSSAQETDFFRGFAATYGDKIEFTVFYSDRPRTASTVEGDTIRFPSSSGFHRTESELERRNNTDQETIGGRLRLDTKIGLFGATSYITQFSSFIQKGTSLSDNYDFTGDQNSVLGMDYRGLIGNSLVFIETARSQNGGVGIVTGIEAPLGYSTELAFLYRNYSKDFQSFMGDGFGESSGNPQNEKGLYVGLRHKLSSMYSFSTYFDQYFFDAPRFGTTQPTQGYDVLGLVEGKLTPFLDAYLLLRNEIKDDEYTIIDSSGREGITLSKKNRASARFQAEYSLSRKVRLRSRIEVVRNKNTGEAWESGFLVFQDVRLLLNRKFQLDARITVFETESFDTRIYQFENDLLYVLSNVALSDKGQRSYVVIKYEPTKFLQFWVKYSTTVIEDAQVLSSGLGEIKGNRRSFLGIQGRLLIR